MVSQGFLQGLGKALSRSITSDKGFLSRKNGVFFQANNSWKSQTILQLQEPGISCHLPAESACSEPRYFKIQRGTRNPGSKTRRFNTQRLRQRQFPIRQRRNPCGWSSSSFSARAGAVGSPQPTRGRSLPSHLGAREAKAASGKQRTRAELGINLPINQARKC